MRKGWQDKKLKEIANYFIGLTYSPKDVSDKGIIVLRSSNVQNNELDLSDLVRVTCHVKDALKVREGDILMCSRNGSKRLVGKTAVIGSLLEDMTFGTFMTVIRSDYNQYLSYFFKSDAFRQQIGVGEHTMINQITKYMLDVVRVPLPPHSEQKKIFTILDEVLDGIDIASANTKKNLSNARELFDSYMRSVFAQKGEGWTEKKLGDICENLDSKRVPITKSERVSGEIPYYGASGIVDYVSGHLFDEDILLISEDGANLLARTYPIAFSVTGKSWVNNHAHVVRFDRPETQRIIELYLNSISLAPYVSGMAQPKLNQKSLNAINVPVPPILEQMRIVAIAESLEAGVERLEEIYREKLRAFSNLKEVILQKAFAGELTARDMEAVPEAAE